MKIITLSIFNLFTSALMLNSCMQDKTGDTLKTEPVLISQQISKNESIKLYSFTVSAKNWRSMNATERSVDLTIPAITEEIVNNGLVMMYLSERDKYLALPFNYYQVRRILSFQPSYEKGRAYITIFGNFILNINEYYHFKLIVVSNEIAAKNKKLNWKNYTKVKAALKLED